MKEAAAILYDETELVGTDCTVDTDIDADTAGPSWQDWDEIPGEQLEKGLIVTVGGPKDKLLESKLITYESSMAEDSGTKFPVSCMLISFEYISSVHHRWMSSLNPEMVRLKACNSFKVSFNDS